MIGYRDGKSVVVCDGCHTPIGEAVVLGECGPNGDVALRTANLDYDLISPRAGVESRSWVPDPDDVIGRDRVRVDHHTDCGDRARTFRARVRRAPDDDPDALDATGQPE